ncbi:MAG: agmatine deiminase family protein [Staphylococcus sp.]|nr:agmatine deiminase family protein [Staphylococcus sp.]
MTMKMNEASDTPVSLRRFPAEWERHDCVLLAWPHEETDWNYMLDEARACIAEIVKAISREECVLLVGPASLCLESVKAQDFDPRRVKFVDMPTNDTWARDFGALTVEANGSLRLLDFKFNGWGLKFAADKDNLINSRLSADGFMAAPLENRLNFVLEGGSVESDGNGTLLTTAECLLSPNRNGQSDRNEISAYLAETFGFVHQLWLHHGALAGDDTDSHIDTLARLAPDNTIVYCGAGEPEGPNYAGLVKMAEELSTLRTPDGLPYNLIELPLPDTIEMDGEILPATYANFLITPKQILLPVYGQPKKDYLASQTLKISFPEHEVVGIDCRALIRQHGSLHCVTMQFPVGAIAGIENGCWVENTTLG